MSAALLIDTLAARAQDYAALNSALGAPGGRPFVYYICPLSNLRNITSKGILPHATAPTNRTDLSGQSVQAKRDIPINLTNWKRKKAHECINLFWNPLNWTLLAFQHKALVREASSQNADDGVVCILEIPLDSLLLRGGCEWTIAPENLASGIFPNFSQDYFTGNAKKPDGTPRCDWLTIFSVGPNPDKRINRIRSAELIVHLGDDGKGPASVAIPFDLINRIIVPSNDVRTLTADQELFLASTGKPITRLSTSNNVAIFASKDELTESEGWFLYSLQNRSKSDPDVFVKINSALTTITQFEKDHPPLSPSRERFVEPGLADGHHGSLHAVRVMFWSAFLAQYLEETLRSQIILPLLVAASLHDTYRRHGQEDEDHGRFAAEAHQAQIANVLSGAALTSSVNAVTFHCVPDEKCGDQDLVLKILKDADALDRGRFGMPGEPGGCDPKFFRTEPLKSGDRYRNIAYAARAAASVTRFCSFDSSPCADFDAFLSDAVNLRS